MYPIAFLQYLYHRSGGVFFILYLEHCLVKVVVEEFTKRLDPLYSVASQNSLEFLLSQSNTLTEAFYPRITFFRLRRYTF